MSDVDKISKLLGKPDNILVMDGATLAYDWIMKDTTKVKYKIGSKKIELYNKNGNYLRGFRNYDEMKEYLERCQVLLTPDEHISRNKALEFKYSIEDLLNELLPIKPYIAEDVRETMTNKVIYPYRLKIQDKMIYIYFTYRKLDGKELDSSIIKTLEERLIDVIGRRPSLNDTQTVSRTDANGDWKQLGIKVKMEFDISISSNMIQSKGFRTLLGLK